MGKRRDGRKAPILGVTAQNVGAAIASIYVDHGAQVVIAGRRTEPLRQIAGEIGAGWVACDITDEASSLVAGNPTGHYRCQALSQS